MCSYGILDHVFHHIADTHVAHHLFSSMPHYHAKVPGGRVPRGPGGAAPATGARPAPGSRQRHILSLRPPGPRLAVVNPHQPDYPHPPETRTQEATEALKPILGPYYCRDDRNTLVALWQENAACHYVAADAPGSGVLWFRTVGSAAREE